MTKTVSHKKTSGINSLIVLKWQKIPSLLFGSGYYRYITGNFLKRDA